MTDVFSYTENGRPWVDIPWLFQWIHAAIYKLVYGLVPVNPADPTANRASAEQIAVGSLVVAGRPGAAGDGLALAQDPPPRARASGGRRSS